MGLIVLVWVMNLVFSLLNAVGAGVMWKESKQTGGWQRLLAWCVAIMAACGFIWCVLLLEVGVAYLFGLPAFWALWAVKVGWLILIPVLVASGLVITIESWRIALREGGFWNWAIALWNTYAQIHNTAEMFTSWGSVAGDVFGAIPGGSGGRSSSSSSDDSGAFWFFVAVVLVLISIIVGVLTTMFIVTRVSQRLELADKILADRAKELEAK